MSQITSWDYKKGYMDAIEEVIFTLKYISNCDRDAIIATLGSVLKALKKDYKEEMENGKI